MSQLCVLSIPRTRPDVAKDKEQVRELLIALEKIKVCIAREQYVEAYQTARKALNAQDARQA